MTLACSPQHVPTNTKVRNPLWSIETDWNQLFCKFIFYLIYYITMMKKTFQKNNKFD